MDSKFNINDCVHHFYISSGGTLCFTPKKRITQINILTKDSSQLIQYMLDGETTWKSEKELFSELRDGVIITESWVKTGTLPNERSQAKKLVQKLCRAKQLVIAVRVLARYRRRPHDTRF